MRRLLSKTEQRKLALVEFLYNKPEYVKFTELSKEMATSERNIRENLQDLKELTNMMTIDIHSEMVKLSFHKNMGMEALTRHFIKNNFSLTYLRDYSSTIICILISWLRSYTSALLPYTVISTKLKRL